jgi:hypothetical protein
VPLVNGDRVPCYGVARDMALTIDMEAFAIGCYNIDLGEFDLILGIEFLRTPGFVLWYVSALRMSFSRGTCHVQWTGLYSRHRDNAGPVAHAVAVAPKHPLLRRLLQQFESVFWELQVLPLARPYHRIYLLLGTSLVVVRPYWFPQLQKDELERQCAYMLA